MNNCIKVDFQSIWEEGTADSEAMLNLETGEVFNISDGVEYLNGDDELEILISQEIFIGNKSYSVTDNEDETGYAYCLYGDDLDEFRKNNVKNEVA